MTVKYNECLIDFIKALEMTYAPLNYLGTMYCNSIFFLILVGMLFLLDDYLGRLSQKQTWKHRSPDMFPKRSGNIVFKQCFLRVDKPGNIIS